MTRVLGRGHLLEVLDEVSCIAALKDHFKVSDSWPSIGRRVLSELPFEGTAAVLVPGVIPGIDAYTVKVNAKFPNARPALRGTIMLHSGRDGELLALMDSATITAWRTGLSAALGTHILAPVGRAQQTVVGIIGAGEQAELVLRGLLKLRKIDGLVVFDIDQTRAVEFASRHNGKVAKSAADVSAEADIVVLATWSRDPLLFLEHTSPGQHFTALGFDEVGKGELASDLISSAKLVVDDRELANSSGILSGDSEDIAAATLSEILRNDEPGRIDISDRTVYAPVGLPWQDLAVAWIAYQEAEFHNIGTTLEFLA